MRVLPAFVKHLLRDRWGLEECWGPTWSGSEVLDADCWITATFKTRAGAAWWAWEHGGHDWGMWTIVRLDTLEY